MDDALVFEMFTRLLPVTVMFVTVAVDQGVVPPAVSVITPDAPNASVLAFELLDENNGTVAA